jgi:hypothetical protein
LRAGIAWKDVTEKEHRERKEPALRHVEWVKQELKREFLDRITG